MDPRWDIEVYLEIAAAERCEIAHVIDTHDHADHVSGRLRLAAATGARATAPIRSESQGRDRGRRRDRGRQRCVSVRCATPGHRPEHLGFAVTDLTRSADPWMVLTGDSLLVGDIARPDLACEAAEGAPALHASLGKLIDVPGHVEVWPAHIGGSLCGGAGLSGKTSSTVGFERECNPLLSMDVEQFVRDSRPTSHPAAEYRPDRLAQPAHRARVRARGPGARRAARP